MKTFSQTPTIHDVAEKAGVSAATVSRVLNGNNGVRPPAKRAVETAIADLGFVPNTSARRLSTGKTFTVGVIAPYFTQASFVERLRGVDSVLSQTEYDLALFSVENVASRDRLFQSVPRRERVDGVIVITLSPNSKQARDMLASGVPVVLVDAEHSRFSCVTENSVAGGKLATKHLLDLGHTRIGYISDDFANSFSGKSRGLLRYEGYVEGLKEAGLAPDETVVRAHGNNLRMDARRMATELLSLPNRPTAIFAFSDMYAIGAIEAARALNLRVPQDVSVIGYDDIEMAELIGLTTVSQSLFDSGKIGAERLVQLMREEGLEDDTKQASLPFHHTMPLKVVERHTTAAPSSVL